METKILDSPRPGDWTASPGPQGKFLASTASEALYGGAAGGGKTETLIVAPLRWVHEPSFRAIIFRRTFPELEKSVIDRARQLYPQAFPGARYSEQKKCWRFPSGALIYFGHVEHDHDVHQYQGAEFSFLALDEATHFTEKQFTYLTSRARSASGLPVRVRCATNPGGIGAEWVMKRWGPWLDPSYSVQAKPCEKLWFLNTEDGERWVPEGTPKALSRVFIPAKISDNPHLTKNDPEYVQRLMGLDALTRERLLRGNWLAQEARGLYFKRAWLQIVETAPAQAVRVRAWDRAASPEGDWTAGVKLARANGVWYVEDVVRFRGTPADVVATIKQTAELDGKGVAIALEQDPGQAGKFEKDWYIRALAGWNVKAYPVMKDKVTRVQPVSAQAEAGNLKLVRGRWNDAFIQELEAFPEGSHDDQVDGLSCGFNAVMSMPYPSSAPRIAGGGFAPFG